MTLLTVNHQDANQHNSSIQTTTKSVHEETVRIVDAQIKDMAVQMQALDEFVTRARSQNERHHETHVQSLQGLSSTVRNSYSSIGEHFTSTYARVRDLGDDMSERTAILQATLPPLNATLRQPLAELRSNIADAPLKEYNPTGETPQKVQYAYPTTLPRTEAHDTLIAKLKRSNPTSSSTSPTKTEPQPPLHQRKSVIFTDAPEGDEVALLEPLSRPTSSSGGLGLREVAVNVNAGTSSIANNIDANSLPLDAMMIPKADKPSLVKRHTTATDSKLPSLLQNGGIWGRPGVFRFAGW